VGHKNRLILGAALAGYIYIFYLNWKLGLSLFFIHWAMGIDIKLYTQELIDNILQVKNILGENYSDEERN